jgi:hypothetical protein
MSKGNQIGDDLLRAVRAGVRSASAQGRDTGGAPFGGTAPGRNRQTVQVVSATPTGNLYPGKIAFYNALTDDYTVFAADVWIRARAVSDVPVNGKAYEGEMWGPAEDGSPVFLVDAGGGGSGSGITTVTDGATPTSGPTVTVAGAGATSVSVSGTTVTVNSPVYVDTTGITVIGDGTTSTSGPTVTFEGAGQTEILVAGSTITVNTPLRPTVLITGSPTGNLWPAQVASYDVSGDSFTLDGDPGDVWARERNLETLTIGDYCGADFMGVGGDEKPVYLVERHCCAAGDPPCDAGETLSLTLDNGDDPLAAVGVVVLTRDGSEYVGTVEGDDDITYTFTMTWVGNASCEDWRMTITWNDGEANQSVGPLSPDEGCDCEEGTVFTSGDVTEVDPLIMTVTPGGGEEEAAFSDSFTASDETELNSRALEVGAAFWLAIAGTNVNDDLWEISGNRATPLGGSEHQLVADLGVADGAVFGGIPIPSSGTFERGVTFRRTDANNYFRATVSFDGDDWKLNLYRVQSGVPTLVDSTTGGLGESIQGTTVAIQVNLSGSGITPTVSSDVPSIIAALSEATDSFNASATIHGFWNDGQVLDGFDDFALTTD